MAIGSQPTEAQLNQAAMTAAACFAVGTQLALQLQNWVVNQGTAGLPAAGFSTDDASAFSNAVSYLNTIAELLSGNATQGSAFNFMSAISELTGPVLPTTLAVPELGS